MLKRWSRLGHFRWPVAILLVLILVQLACVKTSCYDPAQGGMVGPGENYTKEFLEKRAVLFHYEELPPGAELPSVDPERIPRINNGVAFNLCLSALNVTNENLGSVYQPLWPPDEVTVRGRATYICWVDFTQGETDVWEFEYFKKRAAGVILVDGESEDPKPVFYRGLEEDTNNDGLPEYQGLSFSFIHVGAKGADYHESNPYVYLNSHGFPEMGTGHYIGKPVMDWGEDKDHPVMIFPYLRYSQKIGGDYHAEKMVAVAILDLVDGEIDRIDYKDEQSFEAELPAWVDYVADETYVTRLVNWSLLFVPDKYGTYVNQGRRMLAGSTSDQKALAHQIDPRNISFDRFKNHEQVTGDIDRVHMGGRAVYISAATSPFKDNAVVDFAVIDGRTLHGKLYAPPLEHAMIIEGAARQTMADAAQSVLRCSEECEVEHIDPIELFGNVVYYGLVTEDLVAADGASDGGDIRRGYAFMPALDSNDTTADVAVGQTFEETLNKLMEVLARTEGAELASRHGYEWSVEGKVIEIDDFVSEGRTIYEFRLDQNVQERNLVYQVVIDDRRDEDKEDARRIKEGDRVRIVFHWIGTSNIVDVKSIYKISEER